jgi:hypothetical protein
MSENRFPRVVDEVTPEWLTSVLRTSESPDEEVEDLAAEQIAVGVGMLALLYRLTPTYASGSGPSSLVLKLPSQHEPTRQVVRGYRFYEREVAVYRHLAPEVGIGMPRCHIAAHDPATDDFVLLMEDLGSYRSCSQVEGCSPGDAETVLRALAVHHAAWWDSERLFATAILESPADPPYPQFHAESTKDAWEQVSDTFGDVLPAELHGVAARWPEVGVSIMLDAPNHPQTFGHGDLRLDNIFFHPDGRAVSVVDWQLCFRNNGLGDAAYLLSQSLSVEDRRAHEEPVLRAYHETLREHGVRDYGWDELMSDYRQALLFGLAYPLSAAASLDLSSDRAVELATAMFERAAAAILDHDAVSAAPVG